MKFCGVDPGGSGGLAICGDGVSEVFAIKNLTLRDQWEILKKIKGTIQKAFLESVHAFPHQGVCGVFKFGQSFGSLEAFLIASEIPFEYVTPQKWQKEFSLPTLKQCGGSITKKKNAHKARAQELFPGIKITHAVADALLIAEYGRRKELGK